MYNLSMRKYFRKHIAIPQDHGSWVFLLSPLLIGLFAGGTFKPESINLTIAALGAFLLRQPVSMAVKAYAGRRSRNDLPAARFWIIIYGTAILVALAGLVKAGFSSLLYLAIPGIPVFAWHLALVSKRRERRQEGVEIIATGVLSLTAPAAFWVGQGGYHASGWWLWLLTWLQAAGSIVYAYLRLKQRSLPMTREQAQSLARSEKWQMGQRAFAYTSFNLGLAVLLGWLGIIPAWIFVPFLVQWLETLWGVQNPATGLKPTAIGIRQMIVSIVWTILFILFWR
ncbi:MAG: YwiC-like family protein [Anaerolineales bacterium]